MYVKGGAHKHNVEAPGLAKHNKTSLSLTGQGFSRHPITAGLVEET